MAHDTAVEIEKNLDNEDLWNGGESPFKTSYGKLMMWYFLLSDAFTFAGFLIAYGSLRFSMNAWPVPDFVFSTAPFGLEGLPLIFVTFMTLSRYQDRSSCSICDVEQVPSSFQGSICDVEQVPGSFLGRYVVL